MIKLKPLIESFDNSYKFKHTFNTELIDYDDEETGDIYKKEIFSPVQMVFFRTDEGVSYLWYARQDRHDDTAWSIAFGIDNGKDERGIHKLDIGLTKTGNALRIFSTVIDITNAFIEQDENTEVLHLIINSEGDKRTNLYIKHLLNRIDKFKIKEVYKDGNESTIIMDRYE